MSWLRRFVRRSFLYNFVLLRRAWRSSREWTPQDQAMATLYADFLRPGGVCFDVGANIGNRTKVFLKLGARVVAVEPQPLCALILRVVFGRNGRVTVLRKALGAAEGTAQLRVSTASTISSMSTEWIDAVTRSGRFEGSRWTGRRKVAVATLDGLIQRWGEPSFVKIDVEGFEYEVLRGLSRPLAAVAFEFTPEFMSSALKCLNHLQQLGPYRFNYSLGESMEWGLDRWLDGREFATRLETLRDDTSVFGDIYARLP